jgi:hypothetical protein
MVIAGLDPAIHAAERLDQIYRQALANGTSARTTGSSPVVTKERASLLAMTRGRDVDSFTLPWRGRVGREAAGVG